MHLSSAISPANHRNASVNKQLILIPLSPSATSTTSLKFPGVAFKNNSIPSWGFPDSTCPSGMPSATLYALMLSSTSSLGPEKINPLDFAVLKNENLALGTALASLLTRLSRGAAWVANGKAKTATCWLMLVKVANFCKCKCLDVTVFPLWTTMAMIRVQRRDDWTNGQFQR